MSNQEISDLAEENAEKVITPDMRERMTAEENKKLFWKLRQNAAKKLEETEKEVEEKKAAEPKVYRPPVSSSWGSSRLSSSSSALPKPKIDSERQFPSLIGGDGVVAAPKKNSAWLVTKNDEIDLEEETVEDGTYKFERGVRECQLQIHSPMEYHWEARFENTRLIFSPTFLD